MDFIQFKDLSLSKTCQIPTLKYYYERYLPKTGLFVEVGAFDGDFVSNTSGLADFGWQGFYIEPVPTYAKKCAERHANNNVKVYCGALSDREETILITDAGTLSSASRETRFAHSKIEWSRHVQEAGEIAVSAITLNRFLVDNRVNPGFELLVVDVEGFEEKVLGGFDIDRFKPKMMIIELNDYHQSFKEFPSLQFASNRVRNKIIWSGYKQVFADDINSIFVRS
jgi:FkbM family methyltransferase